MYKGWANSFYPEGCPAKRHLEFYVTQFPTVEINLTFYRLPTAGTIQNWREKAPAGFTYAIKGSRFITHMLKLVRAEEALDRFFHDKLGQALKDARIDIQPRIFEITNTMQPKAS